jgi:tRNA threonylcarbamoyladenosine biosynthesis protein TsaB
MELFIDTTDKNHLLLALKDKDKFLAKKKIKTHFNQSEKLWPALDKLLKANKVKTKDIKKIIVANGQGSFTSLRIGIAAANALAYAWGIQVTDDQGKFKRSGRLQIVEPKYSGEAKIS